ncbi:MAG: GWxTD domain-containing protein [bacterium]
MTKRNRQLMSTLLVMVIGASVSWAQPDMMNKQFAQNARPLFYLDAVSLFGSTSEKAQVLIYMDVAYEDLQFVRSGRGYEATYEVDLSVLAGHDENAPRVTNKVWKETVVVSRYEDTNDPAQVSVAQTVFALPSGEYMIVANLTDQESKRSATVKQMVQVPSYGLGGVEMSDLIVARSIRIGDDGAVEIVPNVDKVILSAREPIFIYYEVQPYKADSLAIYARVLNASGDVVRELHLKREATRPVTRDYLKINVKDLPVGRYAFEMQVSGNGYTALKGTTFRIHLSGLPGSVQDLDTAVRQLRYIAKTSEMKKIVKAPPGEKEELFKQFWKERDPSPGTPENELMLEYYSRIERANILFGTFRNGWETDRGEVYIRFGPPSEVERHPFEINQQPYEIWYYYDLQRQFIFVDEMGYGEYRLVSNLWK